jgi:hypothetical protein
LIHLKAKIPHCLMNFRQGTQEDLMQIGNPRSTAKGMAPDKLLNCRMATLGLDPEEIESIEFGTFAEIRRNCTGCGYREACATDLKRDPSSPVWETYCPNAGTLIALAQVRWLPQ